MGLHDINWQPDRRALRTFGVLAFLICAGLGTATLATHVLFGFELSAGAARRTAIITWILGAAAGTLAAAGPDRLRPVYVLLMVITFPIGVVVSYALLALLFFFVITPIGLIFRLAGRDALGRKRDAHASSYWVRRRPAADDMERYFRQY